jgi:hypothetical protein
VWTPEIRSLVLTWVNRKTIEVHRDIEFSRIQQLIDPRRQGVESITDIPQLNLREFNDQTMGHLKEAITEGGDRSGGELNNGCSG